MKGVYTKRVKTALFFVIIFLYMVFFIFPVIWLLLQSLTTGGFIVSPSLELLSNLNLQNYENVLKPGSKFFRNAQNSIVVASATTPLTVFVGSFCAYALARLRVRRAQDLKIWILSLRFLPPIAVVIPLFILYSTLGLIDSHLGLIMVYATFNLPFAVWLMISSFEEIPIEVEEAALIDGCSTFQVFRKIAFPLVRGGMAVVALFIFIACWNEFLFALALTEMRAETLPRGLSAFIGLRGPEWGVMSAISILMMMPILVTAFILQKYIVKGLTFGAVKA